MPAPVMLDLHDFLVEAELQEYYCPLLSQLKVTTVEHLKYVREEDLVAIGMTRPEMRRLKKFYKRKFPQGPIGKLRKAILRSGSDEAGRTMSPSPPAHRGPRPLSSVPLYVRPPGRQLIPIDSIQLGRTLGEGEFGVVQQGIWTTELGEKLQVAVKRLSRERMNTGSQNFLKEAAIMQSVDHNHIVRMFGVVLDTEDNMMLVTELAPMRSLLECLKDSNLRIDLPLLRLCDYAQQVCDGMGYLESKRLVHRDLAARNILVFEKNQVKISDLGLSRLLGAGQDYYQSKFSASLKLPIAWCAPECINFLKFTSASDVWSYGVVLWEFFTYGLQPWAGLNGLQILEAIDQPCSKRLEQPELCTQEIYALMRECWLPNPEARPSFSDILLRLPQLRPAQVKAVKDYPGPVLERGHIHYRAGDVIAVIDKRPVQSSAASLWKGVTASGKCGFFDPSNVVPLVEPVLNLLPAKRALVVRKEASRKSDRKIRADMISRPQNDLRHTGHIGYDGAVFGDVSFIGDNYDKLPVHVGSCSGRFPSSVSLPQVQDNSDHNGHTRSRSQDSMRRDRITSGHSWISQESLDSQSSYPLEGSGRVSPSYQDIEDDSVFADFKMPDLGSSFDFGPSFMDEVLRALDEKEKQVSSSGDTTPTRNQPWGFESTRITPRGEPPVITPRETKTSSSSAAHPFSLQNVEPPKEKKQAKVKPMSASDEKMVDTAIARARELTSHMIGGSAQSPPVSPSQAEKTSFFDEDLGIISRLKNSIKRSSPRVEHKRTFSDERGQKGSLDDELTPEAQQAYNLLVVKGSFKDKSFKRSQQPSTRDHDPRQISNFKRSGSQSSKSSQEAGDLSEPDLIRESKNFTSQSKISAIGAPPTLTAPPLSPRGTSMRPTAPQNQGKPVGVSQPQPSLYSVPVSGPQQITTDSGKMSEVTITRSRPEILRVEPTVRPIDFASQNIPSKNENQLDSHVLILTGREVDEEELRMSAEFVQDEGVEKFSPRSTSDSTELFEAGSNECASDKDLDFRTTSLLDHDDSFTKLQKSSEHDEDLSAPSAQQVMSRLRERRLHRQLDHQRRSAGEDEASSALTVVRPRSSIREPQGIPGRVPSLDADEGGGDGEAVETNPLRMLRGGAIPVRMTGKSASGTSNHSNRGAIALRVPRLNFSMHLSKSSPDQEKPAKRNESSSGASGIIQGESEDTGPGCCITASGPTATLDVPSDSSEVVAPALTPRMVGAGKDQTSNLDFEVSLSLNVQSNYSLPPTSSTATTNGPLQPASPVTSNNEPLSLATQSNFYINSPGPSRDATSLNEDNLKPPRLPPRRSQSLNENPEKKEPGVSQVPCRLRRSNSTEASAESDNAPALPPRNPSLGRTPLNTRPRERKFPLQINLISHEKNNSRQLPASPRQTHMGSPTSPLVSQIKSSSNLPFHSSSKLQSSFSNESPWSPRYNSSSRHPCPQTYLMSRSLDSASHHALYHSSSVELPPAYDQSITQPSSPPGLADSEPTHMLLDPHCPLPLSVSLPPTTDQTAADEPTHVSLSSLIDHKHSWSSTFTSPSPLSPSFHHGQRGPVPGTKRMFDRSFSTEARLCVPSICPDFSDNQSPPADLPPAPPTPSYREKLGLEPQKPKISRSVSHNPNSRTLTPQHLLAVESSSSPLSFRGRSSSTNSPTSRSHHPGSCATSPPHSSNNHIFRFPQRSHETDAGVDNDIDDAFFAGVPSSPQPYSQSPFHPIIPPTNDLLRASFVYSAVIPMQAPPEISPYQVSPAVPHIKDTCKTFSPPTTLRPDAARPPPPRRPGDNHGTPLDHTLAPPPVSPRIMNTSSTNSLPLSPRGINVHKPTNALNQRPGVQTLTSDHVFQSPKPDVSQNTNLNVFRFPSSAKTDNILNTSSSLSASTIVQPGTNHTDLSPIQDYPSSSEVSPLMFASYTPSSSASYEDLRQFALDRQKNCEEIESLLKIFSDQVTVEECMTALERTQWDVTKATKYLQLKKLLSLGVADVHKCKEALSTSGWDLQRAADVLLESAKPPLISSISSPLPSSARTTSVRLGMLTSHNRPASPETVDV